MDPEVREEIFGIDLGNSEFDCTPKDWRGWNADLEELNELSI